MYTVLVIYDIVDNKKRYNVKKILEGYGKRVQRSSFECYITESQLNILIKKCEHIIDKTADSFRVYKMSGSSEIITYGFDVKVFNKDFLII